MYQPFQAWKKALRRFVAPATASRHPVESRRTARPHLEGLEDRVVPSTVVYQRDFEPTTSPLLAPGVSAAWSNTTKTATPTGRTFLGEFDNQSVTLTLTGLPAHGALTIDFDLYLLKTWDGVDAGTDAWGPDHWSFAAGTTQLFDATFANRLDANPGHANATQSFSGQDQPLGAYAGFTGAVEHGTLGYSVWRTDFGRSEDMSAVYHLSFTVQATGSMQTFSFSGSGLQGVADESWGLDNVRVRSDGPPVLNDATFSIPENSSTGTVVGTVAATDPDGDPVSYSITAGNGGGAFAIDPICGQITVANPAPLDYEAVRQFVLTVVATAGGLTDTATVTVNVLNVNEPPEFDSPTDPDWYQFTTGYGMPAGAWVGQTHATDPEGQTVSYQITGGNSAGYWKMDPSGWIGVAKDLPLDGVMEYTLYVQATDPDGASDVAEVTIDLRPLVVLTGDLHGVEVTRDTISLTFVRYTNDYSEPLDVTFSVTWDTATRADLVNPDDLIAAGATERTITIPAGQDRLTLPALTLRADDQVGEKLEKFKVRLVVPAGSSYGTVDLNIYKDLQGKKSGFNGAGEVDVVILEGITLFGADNSDSARRDTFPHGADINDIDQGAVPDCAVMAAFGAMGQNDPHFLLDLFRNNDDGTVSVTFYSRPDRTPTEVRVPMTLDFGLCQAELTGDTDEDGNYEVWPIILEKAYRQYLGWDTFSAGTTAATVWEHLYGTPATTLYNADYTEDQLVDEIFSAWAEDAKVVVASKTDPDRPSWKLSNGDTIGGNHAYVVVWISAEGIELYNPWGPGNNIVIPFDDLKTSLVRIYIA